MSAIFAVVGPSGSGKDTLMDAVARLRPNVHLVQRVITRPVGQTGETFERVSESEFERRKQSGAFVLSWRAHGLSYGIPVSVHDVLAEGKTVLFNGSRAALRQSAGAFPDLQVILITANPELQKQRLIARGREDSADLAARLARADIELPPALKVHEIDNSGPIEIAVQRTLEILDNL